MFKVLLVTHSIIVLFLILLILIQRTDSDGLGGLSGGGGNQFLTGRTQANLLTRATAILAMLFMLTSLTLGVMASRMTGGSIIDSVKVDESAPAEAPKAAAKVKAAPAPEEKQPEEQEVPKPE